MAAADSITFDFSGLYVPPWTASEFEVIYLPFPADAAHIVHPLADDHPLFSLPEEAFVETGENLICFREKRWMGNEKVGTRPLPELSFTQDSLRPEAFAHISLGDTSPESLCALMNGAGLITAPLYQSQRRFIDSRFHDESFPYDRLHPFAESKAFKGTGECELEQAVLDISGEYITALGGSDIYSEPFEHLYRGSLTEAIVLSEYARRYACRNGDTVGHGGIVSYYEVLLTVRALFGAMSELIDFSIAEGSMERFAELAEDRVKQGETRGIHRYALELFSSGKKDAKHKSEYLANAASYTTRESLDFLERCVMTTPGAQWGRVVHTSTFNPEEYDGIVVKMPSFLEPQRNFFEKHEPRYLYDRYMEGSLSAALAAQFLATLADLAPWKRCDNPECGAYFKRHFTTKGSSNPKATSCSPKCSARKRNRLYNLEASAIRTACRRYENVEDAVAYVEKRLEGETELADLPRARRRWKRGVEIVRYSP